MLWSIQHLHRLSVVDSVDHGPWSLQEWHQTAPSNLSLKTSLSMERTMNLPNWIGPNADSQVAWWGKTKCGRDGINRLYLALAKCTDAHGGRRKDCCIGAHGFRGLNPQLLFPMDIMGTSCWQNQIRGWSVSFGGQETEKSKYGKGQSKTWSRWDTPQCLPLTLGTTP